MKKQFLMTSLALAVALSLGGCGQKSTDEYLASANGLITQGNHQAAVIELKSAIQQEPQNAQARLALARVYLKVGDGVGAAKEFNRAIEFGVSNADIAAERIRADYLAGVSPASDILSGVTDGSSTADTVALYKAMIAFEQGQLEDLDQTFTVISRSTAKEVSAFATAYVGVLQKDLAKTVAALELIKADSPLYIDSLMLKARSYQVLNELPKAINALKTYSEAVPQSNIAKIMLAETYVRNNQGAEAEPLIDAMLQRFPEQPIANYLKSSLEFDRKDFVKAKEHAEKAINNGFSTLFPRIIAAMSSINLELNAQALVHFRAVKDELKQLPEVEKVYAILELQAGNTDIASTILKNQRYAEEDLKLIAAATAELSRQGALQSARELLEHVDQNIDKNVQSLAALGMMKMTLDNDPKAGIADLEAALSKDPKETSTTFNLALAYLASAEYAKLTTLTEQWKQDANTKAMAHTFEAYALVQQNKTKDAIAAADEALAADKNTVLAMMLKARIAMDANDFEAAKRYTNQTIQIRPDLAQALEMNYILNKDSENDGLAVKTVADQQKANPERADLRALLGRIYIDKKQYSDALKLIAEDKSKPETRPALLWEIQLTALQQTNELKKLLTVAEEWHKTKPNDPQATIALIQSMALNKQFAPALSQLTDLRKRFPEDTRLKGMEVLLQAETGNTAKALEAMNTLPADFQNNPNSLFLKARLQAAERDFDGAITSLQQSYQLAKLEPTTLALADLLSRNESTEAALKFLDNHFTTEARTPNLQATYANLLLSIEPLKAEQNFLELIKADEENLLALNNLAYLYAQQSKTDQAKIYAEKAIKISPNHPDVLDTLGMVLLKQGDAVKAQEQFKKSLQQRPGHPEVTLNLAEAQITSGDKAAARQTLEKMVNTNPAYQKRKQQLTDLL